MRAAMHVLVVTPTGDTSEQEHGRLTIVTHAEHSQKVKVYRGVVEDVGDHMRQDGLEPGAVAFYTDFIEVLDFHVVPSQNFISFEPVDG